MNLFDCYEDVDFNVRADLFNAQVENIENFQLFI